MNPELQIWTDSSTGSNQVLVKGALLACNVGFLTRLEHRVCSCMSQWMPAALQITEGLSLDPGRKMRPWLCDLGRRSLQNFFVYGSALDGLLDSLSEQLNSLCCHEKLVSLQNAVDI